MKVAAEKDPGDEVDYGFDWTPWLRGIDGTEDDTIVTSSWAIVGTGSLNFPKPGTFTSKKTLVWLGGGDPGKNYVVTNTITTSSGRIGERSLSIPVKQL